MGYVSGLTYSSDEIQEIYTGESSEPIILIDGVTRTMDVAEDHKILGVAGDHNSNPVRFRCPRYIDGGDLTTCTSVLISWQNSDAGTRGEAEVEEFGTDPDDPDTYVVGTWLVDYTVCANAGVIGIFFIAIQEDDDGEIIYKRQNVENTDKEVMEGPNEGYTDVYGTTSSSSTVTVDEDELTEAVEEALS